MNVGKSKGNGLTSEVDGDKIVSGARITDPNSDYANEFAKVYYPQIRKRSTDCKKIVQNIDVPEADIKAIKNYLFMDNSLYDEDLQMWRQFDADCAISQSWQRLADDKDIKPHDLTLINHELYEMEIKRTNLNISHKEAHTLATEKYNYHGESEQYYGKLSKH